MPAADQLLLGLGEIERCAVRFREQDVRAMGRAAAGVRGVRLPVGQHLVGMVVVRRAGNLLVATKKGYGKRSNIADYRLTKRGAGGVITLKTSPKIGEMIAIMEVLDDDDLMIMTLRGVLIRLPIKDVRVIGRATQGVRLIRREAGDEMASSARVIKADEEDESSDEDLDNQDIDLEQPSGENGNPPESGEPGDEKA